MLFPTRVRRFYLLVLRNRKLLQTLVLGSVVHVVRLAQVLERREVENHSWVVTIAGTARRTHTMHVIVVPFAMVELVKR